ncbi:hypothetical protein BFP75_04035 [Maribacter sp. 4G9]|nr:hypothetical protein BFP75_04035 [Maribacter sp. 4G9]
MKINFNFYCYQGLVYINPYYRVNNTIRIMEQELSFGVKLLNGFLKLMIACLIGILVAIPIALILDWLGIID